MSVILSLYHASGSFIFCFYCDSILCTFTHGQRCDGKFLQQFSCNHVMLVGITSVLYIMIHVHAENGQANRLKYLIITDIYGKMYIYTE
jgi:hypothetical protein